MQITHSLWIFDLTSGSHLTGNQTQSLPSTLNILNGFYMSECTDNVILYAVARLVGSGATVIPGLFGAVVFLVADLRHSIIAKVGGNVTKPQNNPRALGLSEFPRSDGGVAEVYWDRCMNDYEAAGAIFHEAAHLKSEQGDSIHNYKLKGNVGGGGVRVLSANGGSFKFPSAADIDFYRTAIKRKIKLRTKVP